MKKNKEFDCVEYKTEMQGKIFSEWESQKGEYASYSEFLEHFIEKADWLNNLRNKICYVEQK